MPLLTAESPVSAVAAFDDDAWEDLLNYIEERRVIPIVGPELTMVQTDAGPENLYTRLARALATRLGMPATGRNGALTRNDENIFAQEAPSRIPRPPPP